MLDRWFLQDVKDKLKNSKRLVIFDPNHSAQFFKEILQKNKIAEIFDVTSNIDEVKTKYEIEKNFQGQNVIIFSSIKVNELTFILEYCETGGFLDLSLLHRYIKQKVNDYLGFDLLNSAEEIVAIGKLSIGKNKDFWDRIKANGNHGIFSLEDILDFLTAPEDIFKNYGDEEKNLFCQYMSDFTPHTLLNKLATTVAKEIADAIFTAIIHKEKEDSLLIRLYKFWLNSKKHEKALKNYLSQFKLPESTNIWELPVDHPFAEADKAALQELINHIENRAWIEDKLDYIKERSNQSVLDIININFWQPVFSLFTYDVSQLDRIHSLQDAVKHYVTQFYKLDNDMRRLYTMFLAEPHILKPLQNYYQQILDLFLSKWFKYFESEYQENQSDKLGEIINNNEPPVAIIVGDAISYGVAKEIAYSLRNEFNITNDFIFAGFPSETFNNMSKLFMCKGEPRDKGQREQRLRSELNKEIEFMSLDDLSVLHKPKKYTIFYSSDVDELSEKQNQRALKYYDEFIAHVGEKINTLFACGYRKIFLVSDHGFVLTGLLDEADKIVLPENDDIKIEERYCLAKKQFTPSPKNLIVLEQLYKGYNFVYFAKSSKPFKSKGPYGFAHGGITPQELIVPFLTFEKVKEDMNTLSVEIKNKEQLQGVVGDYFNVVIMAGPADDTIFSQDRKIQISFIQGKREFYQSDIITIKARGKVNREFPFKEYDSFTLVVLDANTKVILDSCKVEKIIARDLGSLGGLK